jgi:enoyl-CoA hydratase/carnithine racemase
MQSLQLPIIAAVNGVAAGAGVSLALACDLVSPLHQHDLSCPSPRLGSCLTPG